MMVNMTIIPHSQEVDGFIDFLLSGGDSEAVLDMRSDLERLLSSDRGKRMEQRDPAGFALWGQRLSRITDHLSITA